MKFLAMLAGLTMGAIGSLVGLYIFWWLIYGGWK